jgi:hypothetical protein
VVWGAGGRAAAESLQSNSNGGFILFFITSKLVDGWIIMDDLDMPHVKASLATGLFVLDWLLPRVRSRRIKSAQEYVQRSTGDAACQA